MPENKPDLSCLVCGAPPDTPHVGQPHSYWPVPVFPYAGRSGASGSDASHARADHEDSSGITGKRQREALVSVYAQGAYGITWVELGKQWGWHHGQATGVLSTLHKAGHIARLRETRNNSSIYVAPADIHGRPTAPHGRRKATPNDAV